MNPSTPLRTTDHIMDLGSVYAASFISSAIIFFCQ
jgi:hypothetical protein